MAGAQDRHEQNQRITQVSSERICLSLVSLSVLRLLSFDEDKTYTDTEHKAPVYVLGLHLFLVHLIRHPTIPIQQNLLNVTLAMIRIERDGETISRDLLKAMTDMMCELREVSNDGKEGQGEPIYRSWWQEKFLDSSREYYTIEAETNLERLSAPEYLELVSRRLKEEADRIQHYLVRGTEPLLFSLLDHVLIAEHVQGIVNHPNNGLPSLLSDDRYTDLARMYHILGRVGDGRTIMTRALKAWLISQGHLAVESTSTVAAGSSLKPATNGTANGNAAGAPGDVGGDMEDDGAAAAPGDDVKGKGKAKDQGGQGPAARATGVALEWVSSVLQLKDKMDKILEQSFEKDRQFQNATNDAFVSFVNLVKKAPEYISVYLDDNLKKGLKGVRGNQSSFL
jgi:cullin 3